MPHTTSTQLTWLLACLVGTTLRTMVHDNPSCIQVSQLNRQVSAVSTALDRVIIERDHACQELIHAAREKVTALVNYSELSALIHTCLTKKSPQVSVLLRNTYHHIAHPGFMASGCYNWPYMISGCTCGQERRHSRRDLEEV